MADEKIDLPSGAGVVAFRDPEDLTENERRPVREAQFRLGSTITTEGKLTWENIAKLTSVPEAMALALIDNWTLDQPVTLSVLRDLKGRDYDAIMRAALKHETTLLPSFNDPGDPDDADAAANPTGGSSD